MAPLPTAIVFTLAIWLWRGPMSWESGVAVALMLLTTIILRQMSNALQLIRVRSWAVSTVFVLLMAVGASIHQWNPWANAMGVLFIVYIIGLLVSYQSRSPQVSIFWGSAALMTCSLVVPKLLWLLPIIILSMMLPLRCLTQRSLVALLLGLLLPYELWAAWHLFQGTLMEAAVAHWQALYTIDINEIAAVNGSWSEALSHILLSQQAQVMIFFVLYSVISIFHFFRTSLDDKTRTRMLYYSIMMHWPVLLLIVVLQGGVESTASSFEGVAAPQSAMLWPPMCLVSAPLLAHYFVFSRRWAGSLMFYLFLLLCLFLVLRPL